HVFAGAGIVAASDPDAEFAETELKMAAMLDVIDAGPADGVGPAPGDPDGGVR
ncbi:MAG: hypothetical protein D6683_04890, partial [Actinomyces sp.]